MSTNQRCLDELQSLLELRAYPRILDSAIFDGSTQQIQSGKCWLPTYGTRRFRQFCRNTERRAVALAELQIHGRASTYRREPSFPDPCLPRAASEQKLDYWREHDRDSRQVFYINEGSLAPSRKYRVEILSKPHHGMLTSRRDIRSIPQQCGSLPFLTRTQQGHHPDSRPACM